MKAHSKRFLKPLLWIMIVSAACTVISVLALSCASQFNNLSLSRTNSSGSTSNGSTGSESSATVPVSSGLVMLLDASLANAGTGPYSAGSCTGVWKDLSSSGLDGTLYRDTATPTLDFNCGGSDGWTGSGSTASPYGLNFDGANDFVRLPTTSLKLNNGFTIEVWAMYTSSSVWARMVEFGTVGPEDSILFARNSVQSSLALGSYRAASGGNTNTVADAITNGTIQQYAVTLTPDTGNSGTSAFFVNGSAISGSGGTTNLIPRDVTRDLNYLGYNSFGNSLFEGTMYIVRIYNRPLTASEILQNCKTQEARFGLSFC